MKHLVGQHPNIAGLAFPQKRHAILPPGRQVTVETVVRQIRLPPDEPLGERLLPPENFFPRLEPFEFGSNLRPECVGSSSERRYMDSYISMLETVALDENLAGGGNTRRSLSVDSILRSDIAIHPFRAEVVATDLYHASGKKGATQKGRPDQPPRASIFRRAR